MILGYIGAFLLICRLFPIVYEQIYTNVSINPFFLLLEAGACICLGITAIELQSYPFIIANSCSLFNIIIIICININKKKEDEN